MKITLKIITIIILFIIQLSIPIYAEDKTAADAGSKIETAEERAGEEPNTKAYDSRIGTVIETISAGNYIYVLLDVEGSEQWISTFARNLPPDLKTGEKVEYAGGMLIKGFESKSMKKTFDTMLLISMVRSLREKTKLDPDKEVPVDDIHQKAYKSPSKTEVYDIVPKKGEIPRAAGKKGQAHAMTIEEILAYDSKAALPEEQVVVRARVMKIKRNILGKTWVTLQDGTGTSSDDKLIATTTYPIELGKTYRVYGFIRNDVDLGSGYLYKVLFEEAQFMEDK